MVRFGNISSVGLVFLFFSFVVFELFLFLSLKIKRCLMLRRRNVDGELEKSVTAF